VPPLCHPIEGRTLARTHRMSTRSSSPKRASTSESALV